MDVHFREAEDQDLSALVVMLADDELGADREDVSVPINRCYTQIFNHIKSDPNNELVIVSLEQDIVGMLQLTFIPYLTYMGS